MGFQVAFGSSKSPRLDSDSLHATAGRKGKPQRNRQRNGRDWEGYKIFARRLHTRGFLLYARYGAAPYGRAERIARRL